MFNCQYCDAVFVTHLRYSKHLKLFHESSPGFRVTCNIDKCRDSFKTIRYLVRHVKKKHSSISFDSVNIHNVDNDASDDGDYSFADDSVQSQPVLEQNVERINRQTLQTC